MLFLLVVLLLLVLPVGDVSWLEEWYTASEVVFVQTNRNALETAQPTGDAGSPPGPSAIYAW